MKTKVVVSDWDGVLCDSAEIYVAHFNTVLRHYGKEEITIEDFRAKVSCPLAKETFKRLGIEEHDLPDAFRQFMELARLGPQPNLFPYAYDTLRWLHDRSIAVYITSAHHEEDLGRFIGNYGLAGFLTGIRGDARPLDKINFLECVISARGILPDELVFVDDMDEIISLAERVGCYRVASASGFCSYERLRNARPDKIIYHLKGLQGFINWIDFHEQQGPPISNPSKKQSEK